MVDIKRPKMASAFVLAVVMMAGCSPENGNQAATTAMVSEVTIAESKEESQVSDTVSVLAGTSWRLIKIMGMDDSVAEPEDRSLYTLEFNPEGTVALLADCNRGAGSWVSEASGQLQFGPVAATRALCPPDSLSDLYLAQFEWVRSYVMNDGHLFLATMADGSIIEFEPAPVVPLAAIVLGEEVRTTDATEMQQTVLSRLFDQYAAKNGIEVQDEEIDAFVQMLLQGMAADENLNADDDLTAKEVAQVETMRRDMARSMIRQWKLNRALYGQYGGRIIYQQLGPEPLDAYREYLEERQQAGDFTIKEPAFAAEFWRYFTDDSIHSFMSPGSDDEARAFNMPPWVQREGGE